MQVLKYVIPILLILYTIYRWTQSWLPKNEGLTLFFANKGSGKTTLLARYAWYYTHIKPNKYKELYSNVPIKGCKKFDVNKDFGVFNMVDSLLLIDEGAIEFPNTSNMREHQKAYIRLQRHYKTSHRHHNDIIVVSQSWEDINIVLRRVYDHVYQLDKGFGGTSVVKTIRKEFGIDEMSQKPTDIYYYVPWYMLGVKRFDRRKYYHLFNSLDRPELKNYELPEYTNFQEEKKGLVLREVFNKRNLVEIINEVKSREQQEQKAIADNKNILWIDDGDDHETVTEGG